MSNIIQFPAKVPAPVEADDQADLELPAPTPDVPPEVHKAIGLVVAATEENTKSAFIIIGMHPTDSGCDFFTACHGNMDTVRGASTHLDAVLSRYLAKKNL